MFDMSIKDLLMKFVFVRVGVLLIILPPTIHNLVAAFLILTKEGGKTQFYFSFLKELGIDSFVTQYVKIFFDMII